MSSSTPPLQIPEIIRMCGKFLTHQDQVKSMQVSKTWHENMAAVAWKHPMVDYEHLILYSDWESAHGLKVVSWKCLQTYGCHVRSIKMISGFSCHPPESYSRPSNTDMWTMFMNLPSLKCMKLNYINLDDEVLPIFLEICKHLTSLETTNCVMQAPNAKTTSFQFAIQKLSISKGCQMDVVEFISRCPHLKVLTIGTDSFKVLDRHNEQKRMKSLAIFLDSGALHHLEHLDISLVFKRNKDIMLPTRFPCLRSFKAPEISQLTVPGFRTHFPIISKIDTIGPPGFWREVLASCPALVTVRNVNLSPDDIVRGAPWVCTELVDLRLELRTQDNTLDGEAVEDTLFRRISKLRKLDHLGIDSLDRSARENNGKGLASGSWELLSKMMLLTSLDLGYEPCPVLNESSFTHISKLKRLKTLAGSWSKSHRKETKQFVKKFQNRGIEVHWLYE